MFVYGHGCSCAEFPVGRNYGQMPGKSFEKCFDQSNTAVQTWIFIFKFEIPSTKFNIHELISNILLKL